MQPSEGPGNVFIIVIDETYGGDESTYEEESAQYHTGLEQEFGQPFTEVNVGPGADIPAFLTSLTSVNIPAWSVALGALFVGKRLKENLEAWIEMARATRRFFRRPVILGRHGAAIMAIEAIFDTMGGMPKSVQLLGYRTAHVMERGEGWGPFPANKIDDSPPVINLGLVVHVFDVEADGQRFRVTVDGKDVETIRMSVWDQRPS